ncbi:phytoene desaturase [Leucobacter weissii]|uniref:Phytoene desaturase n=1 Tax=Leucobacter weissii TaxID=1983706 RepID=A0A939MT52_9MICO|nr:phytoene desaturase family protein [Leucobacter weissii]MBO1902509.1 phytoene desaturase [Leucobacter weissii]
MSDAIVIGGGIAGLASAALLAADGHSVRVLERNARLGGRAGVLEEQGFRFDTGPSWYLMPRVFDHFFELLGTSTAEQLDLTVLDPGYRVFAEPAAGEAPRPPLDIPHGSASVREVFESREPGAGSRLGSYLDSAGEAAALAERFFLYNPFTRPSSLLDREVLRATPRLLTLLGTSLERFVARRFRDPVLRQILGYPAVFLGTRPSDAPAMYHLMSALDLDEGVQYPMGGFWALVERLEALAREAGAEIITEAEAVRISTAPGGSGRRRSRATGAIWRGRDGAERSESADIVVSAADLHHTETALLSEADQSYPERWWSRRVSGPGGVLLLLGVSGSLPSLPHHSLLFAADWKQNFDAIFGARPRVPDPASLYMCRPSATEPGVAPPDHENLFVLVPVPADPDLGGGGDPAVEAAADAAIDRIAEWAGIPDLRERIVFRRTIGPRDFAEDYRAWSGGMLGPAHVLSQSALFRAQNESKRVSGLFYAGGTTAPGVGVPMCLISAELVLKRVRGDRSAGPLPTPLRAGKL